MTSSVIGFKRLTGRVASVFRVETRIASTYCADAYVVQGRVPQAGNVLWKTRGPVASRYLEKFFARLELMMAHRGVVPIVQYGVDVDNIGYAVINAGGLSLLSSQGAQEGDFQRLFGKALVVVESLHARGLACGDISAESFAVGKDGRVVLFAPLGDVECENEIDELKKAAH